MEHNTTPLISASVAQDETIFTRSELIARLNKRLEFCDKRWADRKARYDMDESGRIRISDHDDYVLEHSMHLGRREVITDMLLDLIR